MASKPSAWCFLLLFTMQWRALRVLGIQLDPLNAASSRESAAKSSHSARTALVSNASLTSRRLGCKWDDFKHATKCSRAKPSTRTTAEPIPKNKDSKKGASSKTSNIAAPLQATKHEPDATEKSRFCKRLGSPSPHFVAVVARWDEDVSWTKKMPMPVLVYEHAKPNSTYNVAVNKGSETSSYLQFMIDHYECLPEWVLFLHGHGKTVKAGHPVTRHHATDPERFAALIDVKKLGRGFVGLGHVSEKDWKYPKTMDARAKAFSNVQLNTGRHHAMFEPQAKGKVGCKNCAILQDLFPGINCKRGWAWSMGAEFWTKGSRIHSRPKTFWKHALILSESGNEFTRFGHFGVATKTKANQAGYCFESVWHALLGEEFYGYTPAFKIYEDLPRVSHEERCASMASRPLGSISAPGCDQSALLKGIVSPEN